MFGLITVAVVDRATCTVCQCVVVNNGKPVVLGLISVADLHVLVHFQTVNLEMSQTAINMLSVCLMDNMIGRGISSTLDCQHILDVHKQVWCLFMRGLCIALCRLSEVLSTLASANPRSVVFSLLCVRV